MRVRLCRRANAKNSIKKEQREELGTSKELADRRGGGGKKRKLKKTGEAGEEATTEKHREKRRQQTAFDLLVASQRTRV